MTLPDLQYREQLIQKYFLRKLSTREKQDFIRFRRSDPGFRARLHEEERFLRELSATVMPSLWSRLSGFVRMRVLSGASRLFVFVLVGLLVATGFYMYIRWYNADGSSDGLPANIASRQIYAQTAAVEKASERIAAAELELKIQKEQMRGSLDSTKAQRKVNAPGAGRVYQKGGTPFDSESKSDTKSALTSSTAATIEKKIVKANRKLASQITIPKPVTSTAPPALAAPSVALKSEDATIATTSPSISQERDTDYFTFRIEEQGLDSVRSEKSERIRESNLKYDYSMAKVISRREISESRTEEPQNRYLLPMPSGEDGDDFWLKLFREYSKELPSINVKGVADLELNDTDIPTAWIRVMETSGFSPYMARTMFASKQKDIKKRLRKVYATAVNRDFFFSEYPFKRHDVVIEIYLVAQKLKQHPSHGRQLDSKLRLVADNLAKGARNGSWYYHQLLPLMSIEDEDREWAKFSAEHIGWILAQTHLLTGEYYEGVTLLKNLSPTQNFLFPYRYNLMRFYRP